MVDEERRKEIGDFLRQKRKQVQPADVGLPAGARRRTPGLRREEVAQLAGISVTWYTWLEQGRDINVSQPVLESVARVLQLDQAERNYFFTLATSRPPLSSPSPDERASGTPQPAHKR